MRSAKVYGVTRERIRQIEKKVMSKLRHPSRSDVLKPYLFGDGEKPKCKEQLETVEPQAAMA